MTPQRVRTKVHRLYKANTQNAVKLMQSVEETITLCMKINPRLPPILKDCAVEMRFFVRAMKHQENQIRSQVT